MAVGGRLARDPGQLKHFREIEAEFAALGNKMENVTSAATEMQSSAVSMASTAEETNVQAVAVATAAEQASVKVQTVASAAEELSASITEMSRQVAQSSEISSNAVLEATRTDEKVQGLASQKVTATSEVTSNIASVTQAADETGHAKAHYSGNHTSEK